VVVPISSASGISWVPVPCSSSLGILCVPVPISSALGFSSVPASISYAHTSPIECIGGCFVRGGACVDPLGGLFCVHSFFLAGVLPPSWPWAFLFLVPDPLVHFWCTGAGLSYIRGRALCTMVGIWGTFHSLGHSWTSLWIYSCMTQ
jgi:hypothetical protein